MLWVEGEISNFARPASGHWYLTLKDGQAQVRCAMFRNSNMRVNFKPANGTQVLVRGRVGLYEGRGGGSLEDLWPFNEESVARAIFASEIPMISAVGHEIDFTIADFVADLRAPTPSAAAELISPDGEDMLNQFEGFELLLAEAMARKTYLLSQQVSNLHKRLQHPGRKLQEQAQHLDHLDIRLRRAINSKLQQQRYQMDSLQGKLSRLHPANAIINLQQLVTEYLKRMSRGITQQIEKKKIKTSQAMHLLDTVSPLKTLGRGYSIIRNDRGAVVKSVVGVDVGDKLKSQVADGEIYFTVDRTTDRGLSGSE